MTAFLYNGLNREVPNSKVSSSEFWPIARSYFSNQKLMNAAKCQRYLCCSESKINTFVSSIFRFPPLEAKKPKNSFFRVFII